MKGGVAALAASSRTLLVIALLALAARAAPAPDAYRTEVIFLSALPAERALLLHERLLGQAGEGNIVRGRQPNVVVVKDTPERLARFHALLAALDREGAAQLRIFIRPVQHVMASELAALAGEVVDDPALRMVPDDRSRQLVVMARPETYRALDRLLRKLDVPSDKGRQIRVTPAPADSRPGEFPP